MVNSDMTCARNKHQTQLMEELLSTKSITNLIEVGARKQMLGHARELSFLCLLVTFVDARVSPTLLVFINQTKPNVSDLLMMHTNHVY